MRHFSTQLRVGFQNAAGRALLKSRLSGKRIFFCWHGVVSSECYLRRLGRAVILSEVAVCTHRQRAAVGMSKPSRYGRNIHAALNASRGEKVSEIVVRD